MNIEQEDVPGVWNFVQLLQRYTAVYTEKETDIKTRMDELPDPWSLRDELAFQNLMERVGLCLEALHRHNIYGYAAPPMGSADGIMGEETSPTRH